MILLKIATFSLLLSSFSAFSDDRINTEMQIKDFLLAANEGQRTPGTNDPQRRAGLYDNPDRKSGAPSTARKIGESSNRTSGKNENLQRDPGGNKKEYVSERQKRKDETSKRVKADREKRIKQKNKNRLSDYND